MIGMRFTGVPEMTNAKKEWKEVSHYNQAIKTLKQYQFQ